MSIIAESRMFFKKTDKLSVFLHYTFIVNYYDGVFLQKQLLMSFLSSIMHVCIGLKYASLRSFHNIFRGIVEAIVAFPTALQLGLKKWYQPFL